jgi:hypothetical protein
MDFLVFVVIPFCISDFTDLGLFPPHFSQICQGSANLIYFFKEPAFLVFLILCVFLVSISLILALIFIIFFFLLDLCLLVLVFLGV